MGGVLNLWPSWHGPSFMWVEMVLGQVVLHPTARPSCDCRAKVTMVLLENK